MTNTEKIVQLEDEVARLKLSNANYAFDLASLEHTLNLLVMAIEVYSATIGYCIVCDSRTGHGPGCELVKYKNQMTRP